MNKLTLTNDFKITPEQVAELFCTMDNIEQAAFFNAVAEDMKTWDTPYVFQLQSLTSTSDLTDDARNVMREIGNYSQKPEKMYH